MLERDDRTYTEDI